MQRTTSPGLTKNDLPATFMEPTVPLFPLTPSLILPTYGVGAYRG